MGRNWFYEKFGMKNTKWAILIVLGIVAFTLIFATPYAAFYGDGGFLTGSYSGFLNIPAKILGVLIIAIMVSVHNT